MEKITTKQATKIATYMIDTADKLTVRSLVTLAVTLQPFLKGVQMFVDNKYVDQFANSTDIRSTDIGIIIFNHACSERTPELRAQAIDNIVALLVE